MTPLEMARTECANWDSGACLGISADSLAMRADDPHPPHSHPLARCLLHDDQACVYFERCVLPLANYGKPAWLDARQLYNQIHAVGAMMRKCACGQPKAPRRRFCETCAHARRRQSNRNAQRRQRDVSS